MYRTEFVNTSYRREIELAHRVQHGLLPQKPPSIAGLEIGATLRSAYQVGNYGVGGDFYDFIPNRKTVVTPGNRSLQMPNQGLRGDLGVISSSKSNSVFTFVVGDICGKGLAASILMSMTRIVVRMITQEFQGLSPASIDPAKVIHHANSILYEEFSDTNTFATVFIGSYDPATQLLVYANAGHSPVIYLQAKRGMTCGCSQMLVADGAPMGVLPAPEDGSGDYPKNHYLNFQAGDVLVIATDGLLGNLPQDGDLPAGYDQLLRKVELMADRPAHLIVESLINQPAKQNDSPSPKNYPERVSLKRSGQNPDYHHSWQAHSFDDPEDDQALVVIKNIGE